MHTARAFNQQQFMPRVQLTIGSHYSRQLDRSPFSPRCVERRNRKPKGIGSDKIQCIRHLRRTCEPNGIGWSALHNTGFDRLHYADIETPLL